MDQIMTFVTWGLNLANIILKNGKGKMWFEWSMNYHQLKVRNTNIRVKRKADFKEKDPQGRRMGERECIDVVIKNND